MDYPAAHFAPSYLAFMKYQAPYFTTTGNPPTSWYFSVLPDLRSRILSDKKSPSSRFANRQIIQLLIRCVWLVAPSRAKIKSEIRTAKDELLTFEVIATCRGIFRINSKVRVDDLTKAEHDRWDCSVDEEKRSRTPRESLDRTGAATGLWWPNASWKKRSLIKK